MQQKQRYFSFPSLHKSSPKHIGANTLMQQLTERSALVIAHIFQEFWRKIADWVSFPGCQIPT